MIAVVSYPPLLTPPKMEDKLSDAVARFVLEVGGLENGV